MENIDETKAFVTLADGTRWQVLGEDGEMDAEATQSAIAAHLANQ